jgi:hypothetical protein
MNTPPPPRRLRPSSPAAWQGGAPSPVHMVRRLTRSAKAGSSRSTSVGVTTAAGSLELRLRNSL